ncbi:MAG: hypothetical protein JKX76_03825, partial [Colwellia sp.]|nr:hypothetical protein [Colwellia sp.]
MSQTFKINNSVLILQTLVVSGWVLSIDIYIISRLGIMFFVYVILRFLQNLGRELPMRELTLMIMLLQLLICPILVYHYFDNDVRYPMEIAEIPYVNYVFLAISLFALGLFVPLNLGELRTGVLIQNLKATTKSNGKFGMILIFVGYASTFVLKFIPSSLAFVAFLLINFKFVGAFLVLFSSNKYKYLWLVLVFGLYTLDIISGGLFINLFVWGLMLLIIVLIKIEVSYLYKVLLLVAGFSIVFFVNGFKSEYREVTWRQDRSISERPRSNQEVFLDIAFERAQEMTLEESEKDQERYDNFNDFVSRLNQGWIVAKVMNHVPMYEPYTGGETIVAD